MMKRAAGGLNPTGELLHLDRFLLLDALDRVRQTASIAALRREVKDLKKQLCDPESNLRRASTEDAAVPFESQYLCEQLDQIAASQTVERGLHYTERLVKSVTEIKVNELNDINLNRWKEYTDIYLDSLWNIDRRESTGAHSAGYWGNFIPQIPHQMMRRYTKPGDWVLDTFAGCGTTLIEGQRLGRNTIGVELQQEIAERARHLVSLEPNPHNASCEIVTGDSTSIDYRAILEPYHRRSVQLVMMHPPYFDIIKFSDDQRDLSNAATVDDFLRMMGQVVDNAARVLEPNRYLVVVIGDKYAKGEWIPLGFLTMNEVLRRGFSLKSIVVKNFEETTGKRQQKELWRYRALVGGFYIFKHEYIFIFKKDREASM
jgi:DNA modification methylase